MTSGSRRTAVPHEVTTGTGPAEQLVTGGKATVAVTVVTSGPGLHGAGRLIAVASRVGTTGVVTGGPGLHGAGRLIAVASRVGTTGVVTRTVHPVHRAGHRPAVVLLGPAVPGTRGGHRGDAALRGHAAGSGGMARRVRAARTSSVAAGLA